MNLRPGDWIGIVWVAWAVSWLAAAIWSNGSIKHPGGGREWPYRLITLAGALLLIERHQHHPIWHNPPTGWAGLALVIAGIAFAWWARLHLGRLWSGDVAAKADHRIIDTGPYALVRHPIYTGLLTSVIGSALANGDPRSLAGAALIILGTFLKARLEETFLREQLGDAAYAPYAARVPMLVPLTRFRH